jgi:hypothetical protein
MKRFLRCRRVLRVLAVLALAFGAIAAVVPAASANSRLGCYWTPLTLVNGWQSANSTYGTGDPSYCVLYGIVYLSGSLSQTGSGGTEFAVLPAAAVPASKTYLSTYTFGGTAGVVQIDANGVLFAFDGKATSYTSLAGISFPAAESWPSGLPLLPLENGWQSADPVYGSGSPSWVVDRGIVHLSGSMTTDGIGENGLFSLEPTAIMPDSCVETSVYSYGGTVGFLAINGTGDGNGPLWVQDTSASPATGPYTEDFTSLAGVAYPAAGAAWQPLSLINGWVNGEDNCDNNAPSYYTKDGVVYLNGLILQAPYDSCEFAVLPPAARPAHTLYLIANAEGVPIADLEITPGGTTCAWSNGGNDNGWNNGGAAGTFISLGGISYQATS